MKQGKKGYVEIYRDLTDHWIWKQEEEFDKRSAWIDLLLMVNHTDKEVLINGHIICIQRGQRLTSEQELARRWKWSRNKVRRFINLLENETMLSTNKRQGVGTIITIENYCKWQGLHKVETEETIQSLVQSSIHLAEQSTIQRSIQRSEQSTGQSTEHKQPCITINNHDRTMKINYYYYRAREYIGLCEKDKLILTREVVDELVSLTQKLKITAPPFKGPGWESMTHKARRAMMITFLWKIERELKKLKIEADGTEQEELQGRDEKGA